MKIVLLLLSALTALATRPTGSFSQQEGCDGEDAGPNDPQVCIDHCSGFCTSKQVETSWGTGFRCDCDRARRANECCDWVFIPGRGAFPHGSCTSPICPGGSEGCHVVYLGIGDPEVPNEVIITCEGEPDE